VSCRNELETYREMLLRWTAKVNLIGPEAREHLDEHIEEAVEAGRILEPRGIALDFGSGGGLPAIPLAICHREATFHMVESDQKKWAFLKHAARELALNSVVWGDRLTRALAAMPASLRFDLVTSRAVGKPAEWVPQVRERLAPKGRVALFQAEASVPEIEGMQQIRAHRLSRGESNYLVELARISE
jgi:16S rRNA (guanine527-N7)-methyltransferase